MNPSRTFFRLILLLWIANPSYADSATGFEPCTNLPSQTVASPDSRYVYTLSCDGWVQKHDALTQKQLGRVRTGLAARNIAISGGGKWLAIANIQPTTMTILSGTDMSVVNVIKARGRDGAPSGLTAVYDNPMRESFIFTLTEAPKIWEVFYGPNPPEMGFAHDWRTEGPVPQATPFPIRKITTADYLTDLVFDPSYEYVLAAARRGGGMVIDLVIGQKVADLDLPGRPHFGGGYSWNRAGKDVIAVPHANGVSLIEMLSWETVGYVSTSGAAQSVHPHENTNYFWVDVRIGPNKNLIEVFDKLTLQKVAQP